MEFEAMKCEDMEQTFAGRTVHEVFAEFKSRRAGIIKALTSDFQEFYQKCDPDKDNLSLYGLPNENWCVECPEFSLKLPEPVVGINFSRDGMEVNSWLTLIALHSQPWLVATAFHIGSWARFNKYERGQLFAMINRLPTVLEVLNEAIKKQSSNEKEVGEYSKHMQEDVDYAGDEEGESEDDEEGQQTVCVACGFIYVPGEFWICCDVCETWFHGKCVKITPDNAKLIDKYMCPLCSNKRARP